MSRSMQSARLEVMELEGRCTPTSFTAVLGGDHAAVSLAISIISPKPYTSQEIVTVSMSLPHGKLVAFPPAQITPPSSGSPPQAIHELLSSGALRGRQQSAHFDGSFVSF